MHKSYHLEILFLKIVSMYWKWSQISACVYITERKRDLLQYQLHWPSLGATADPSRCELTDPITSMLSKTTTITESYCMWQKRMHWYIQLAKHTQIKINLCMYIHLHASCYVW